MSNSGLEMERKVSIIVPVYKVEQYLNDCVSSILSQIYKNLEVILVDDGSPDRSSQMCDEWAKMDSRVRVIHKSNGGLSSARNAGLDVATGEYVNFCDSDDIIDSMMIKTLVDLHQQYKSDIVECESVLYCDGRETIIPQYHKADEITHFSNVDFLSNLLQVKCDCSVCNKLFIRKKINDYRFVTGKTNEDILLLLEMMEICNSITHINKGYYKYRVNPSSITHLFNESSLDLFYNTCYIRDIVYLKYPELSVVADNRLVRISWMLISKLHSRKEKNIPPFSHALISARKIIIKNLGKIFFSIDYKLMSKLKLIYLLLS